MPASLTQQRLPQESKTRLTLWLLLIRSRVRRLGGILLWQRYHHSTLGYTIHRPFSPINRVLSGYMEGVVVMDGAAAYSGKEEDGRLMMMLRTLIALILYESREENDYRHLFIRIIQRINVHIERLMQDGGSVLVGEMVFLNVWGGHG